MKGFFHERACHAIDRPHRRLFFIHRREIDVTEAEILPFSERCARSYCKKFNAWAALDDATQEAALFLCQNRALWEKPDAWLRRRVCGQLVRNYQNEHKIRTKSPLFFTHGAFDEIEPVAEPESETEDPRLSIIQTALRQPDVAPWRHILVDIVDGELSRKEIAAKHGVSQSWISQLFARFKIVCSQMDPNGGGAVLVDTLKEDPTAEERAACPLFYQ